MYQGVLGFWGFGVLGFYVEAIEEIAELNFIPAIIR